jgi:hypothetical protein
MAARSSPSSPDYYARLDVPPSASQEEIRTAYWQKARETHPDRNPDDPRAAERFRKIQTAYRTLRDPEQRAQYDQARASVRPTRPKGLTVNLQAPAGCGGYLWRVFAGLVAVGLFLVLEALDVWAASTWTILGAVGIASLVAGGIAVWVASQFPEEAHDAVLHMGTDRLVMQADGRTVLRVPWAEVTAVSLHGEGWTLVLEAGSDATPRTAPLPPILTAVQRETDRIVLRFDLSDTDVTRDALLRYLRTTDAVPFPRSDASPSA